MNRANRSKWHKMSFTKLGNLSPFFSALFSESPRQMEKNLKHHPAVKFGKWLKSARQSKGIVKRVFACEVYLTPSKYSEVEAGVVRWVHELQEQAIEKTLELIDSEIVDFKKLLQKAREAIALTFSHLFTRDQLEPMRLRSDNHRQPTASDKDIILNAVFTPIL